MIEHFYADLPGWFDFEDIYLDEINRAPKDSVSRFVEVGCYRGRSLAFLATQAANSEKRFDLVGVDLFAPPAASTGELWSMLKAHGLGNVSLIQGNSWEAAAQFHDGSLDFVFIDASHEYEDVIRDLKAWHPKAKTGGTFAGHDYSANHPGVVRAVEEFFGGPVKRKGTSWVTVKP